MESVDRNSYLVPATAAALLLFTLGVVLPYRIFIDNAQEFSITLDKLVLVACLALMLLVAIAGLLFRFIHPLRNPKFVAVLFAVAMLVWLQGTVIVWQYGPLDGRMIDWNVHQVNGWIDTSIWLFVLGLAFWQAQRVCRIIVFVSTALIALQTMALLLMDVNAPKERIAGTVKAYTIDSEPKYFLSRGRNVFLIVLDEVQSDVFLEVVDADETYRRIFDGFTYFPDAVAAANFTELAIPGLLTGRLYDNSLPKSKYLSDAYLNDSIFVMLKRNGFRVDIYPWVGWGNETIYFDESIADNLRKRQGTSEAPSLFLTEKQAKEIIHLADLALFRAAPHFLKPLVFNNHKWLLMGIVSRLVPDELKAVVSNDNEFETTVFANQAEDALRILWEKDSFKYYHLKGAHKPLTVLPDLQVDAPVPFSRERYVLQVQASLNALGRFFSALKQMGVWDNAVVIVVSDHGSGETERLYINSEPNSRASLLPGVEESKRRFAKDKARGVPLVLIKGEQPSSDPMRVSNAPVSLLDLPATIAAVLELPWAGKARSMFSLEEDEERVRSYVAFDYSETKTSFVGPMTRYSIQGHSWADDSWSIEGILRPMPSDASSH